MCVHPYAYIPLAGQRDSGVAAIIAGEITKTVIDHPGSDWLSFAKVILRSVYRQDVTSR